MTPEEIAIPTLLAWLDAGDELLGAHLADADVEAPSRLPGWTAGHLLTHLARNADALGNLVAWAATGVESPMYPAGQEGRNADIEAGAFRPAPVIRQDVADSSARLRDAMAALPADAWRRTVRTAQGRPVPASLIVWLRNREVWLHTIDLGTGADVTDLPGDLARVLLSDVVESLNAKDDCPALTLRAGGLTYDGAEIAGSPAALAGWLTGRTAGEGLTHSGLPTPPKWL